MDISGTKIQGPRTHISEGKKWSQDSEGKADERRKTEKKEKKIKKNIKKKVILVRRCANLCGVVSLPKRILLSNHSTQYTNSLRRHLSTCVQCANILNTVHKLTFVATWIDVCKYVQYSLLTHFYCHVLGANRLKHTHCNAQTHFCCQLSQCVITYSRQYAY